MTKQISLDYFLSLYNQTTRSHLKLTIDSNLLLYMRKLKYKEITWTNQYTDLMFNTNRVHVAFYQGLKMSVGQIQAFHLSYHKDFIKETKQYFSTLDTIEFRKYLGEMVDDYIKNGDKNHSFKLELIGLFEEFHETFLLIIEMIHHQITTYKDNPELIKNKENRYSFHLVIKTMIDCLRDSDVFKVSIILRLY